MSQNTNYQASAPLGPLINSTSNIPYVDESVRNSVVDDGPTNHVEGPTSVVVTSPRSNGRNIGWAVENDDKTASAASNSDDNNGSDASTARNEDAPPNQGEGRRKLRRNSISLPSGMNDLDLELLRAAHNKERNAIPENGTSTNSSYSEGEESEDDLRIGRDSVKVPLRHHRKKSSVLSPYKTADEMDSDSNSPANSITSINSLASLLKEKMQNIQTSVLKKKKRTPDYRIRVFVGFLFLCIVFLIGFAYVMYHQQILQKAYFDKLKFNKNERSMKIFNAEGIEILRGNLGTTMNTGPVYNCLPGDELDDGSICFEWMYAARLYLNYKEINDDVRCYMLNWVSLSHDVDPTDCFDWSFEGGHWYGGGQTSDNACPLDKGTHDFTPFITGDAHKRLWSNVLNRYFISSNGVAIVVDPATPLYTSINARHSKQMCLKAKYDDFAFVNRLTPTPHLNYSICTGSNMKKLHNALSEKSLWDGLKQEDVDTINSLLSEPVWQIAPNNKYDLTESTIYNYTEDVISLGFLKQGHVLVNEFWQEQVGDFTLDTERFPTLKETVNIIHRRGFRIVFSIQPYISTESMNFAECNKKRLLISERSSVRRIPALTSYKSVESAGVLDFTNNYTIPWLHRQLKYILDIYNVDSFYLDIGTAFDLPYYYQCKVPLMNPDEYKTILINGLQGSISLIGVSSAIKRPRPPIFVSLPPFESSWKAIRTVIPTVLTYGINGYPFLIPGAVGGDIEPKDVWNPNIQGDQGAGIVLDIELPDKELYIRWLQLATFLPVVRFMHLPSKYEDVKVLEITKILTSLRQQVITPLLKKYARESLDSGLPMIRPLWMLDPMDPSCHQVIDQFSVGEELIVAPVLMEKSFQREVYLPAGVWKDGIDGSLRKGSRWMHNYKVNLNQIAYFQKMPDNTRF